MVQPLMNRFLGNKKLNNRLKSLLLTTIFLLHGALALEAQPFEKAPKVSSQKVKQIVEWIRLDFDQKAVEGSTCIFDRNGNLLEYFQKTNLPVKQLTCKYDNLGRISEKTEWFDGHEMRTFFAHKKDQTIEELKFRGKTNKIFYYKNIKGQLVEKKTYTKGLELGESFRLKERIVYHFNKHDSLSGETIYNYDLLKNGGAQGKQEVRRILHFYSGKTPKRSKTLEYDFDGSLITEILYEYDSQQRLTKTLHHFKNDNSFLINETLYKDGKIWQSISQRPGYKDVRVYVNGRLIRLRSYNENHIIRIVDYQYFYY